MSEQSHFICENCRQIDFASVSRLNAATLQASANSRGIQIAQLATSYNGPVTNGCQLCQLFHAAAAPSPGRGLLGWELRAFSFLKCSRKTQIFFCPKALREMDQPTLAVLPPDFDQDDVEFHLERSGHILCRPKESAQPWLFNPQVLPDSLDYHTIANWLEFCRSNHKKLCGSKNSLPSGLRLIDCSTLAIEAAPPLCSYATLSYVWGNSRGSRDLRAASAYSLHLSKENLPKVVLDAVIVTKGLGIGYLWIDKYCIDQNDPTDKHAQIGQMDAIYSRADITIIAAAGEDETFGLPGVGPPRNPQPVVMLKDFTIVSTMAHPHISIRDSRWWTRGWTYQEAVLSRRRLVFTKDQTYFECNAMNCYESLSSNLALLHVKNKYKFQRFLHSGILSGRGGSCFGPMDMENLSPKGSWGRYTELVQNYTMRDLTYEEDSLRAFTGIIRDVAKSKFPVRQLWGVPFLAASPEEQSKYLTIGLLWKHKFDCWSTSEKPHRRHAFPSWSWAGWKGAAEFLIEYPEHGFEPNIGAVFLEVEPGALVEHFYLTQNTPDNILSLSYPLALHIDVWIIPPEKFTFDTGTRVTCKLDRFGGKMCLLQDPGDRRNLKAALRTRKWEVVVLGSITWTISRGLFLMVIEHNGNSASRVGTISVPSLEFRELERMTKMERRRIRLT